MSVTVLNLTEASTLLRTINKRDIKDVRAIDNDLALVMENGHKIIISRGAVTAVNSPQLVLEFADGDVALGDVFEKLNHIEVASDATAPLMTSEVKRYGIKRVVKAKDTAKDKDEEQAEARAEIDDGKPVATLASDGALKQPVAATDVAQKSTIPSSSLTEGSSTEAADNGGGLSFSWPVVAGGLGLLAAAAGGGGGGGGGGGQSGAAAVPKAGTTLSGATVLGPLNNATITAYDSQGNVIGKPVPVINGRYSLVLDQPDYKGLILLAVRDNTPGVADNFADEATLRITDLGNTVLRSVVLADGSNQTINVTALTELAVLKAGLSAGQTNLAASQISVTKATDANAAVSALFKVNITAGEVLATSITDSNGAAVVNPDFARGSTAARNYGIALKAISNLSQTDPARYPDQGTAIRKLADSLQFDDATKPKWSDTVTQSDLFNERLNTLANDPTLSEAERNQARERLASLQKLPDGSTVNDHLLTNHIGILEPTILIRNATPGASPWQAPADGKLVLDETELSNGGLAVKAPPQARVEVTLIGQNAQGQEIVVRLPASIADGNGIAVLRANQAALDLFKQMTREQPVTARVTVTDGDTSRSNQNVWKGNADVHIDVVTPPGLTDFADNKIALVNDSFYGGADGDTTALGSNSDRVTNDAAVRVLLTRVLKPEERLEFQVATTTTGANNAPVYGNWFTPADLKATAPDSNGQVGYVSSKLPLTEGQVWLKARIVRTAAQSGVAQGSTRELGSELKFTLDKTAPAQVPLRMEASGDDGISSADGISSQTGILLSPQLPLENGAEVHLRLLAGSGTDGNTLQLVHANGSQEALTPGNWVRWQSGDQLRLIGQTLQGNGKARLQVRQIDAAGNFTDSTQSFVADSTRVIEQVVLLASREQALTQAKAAVIAAQEAYDSASAADKPARQASLTDAQTRLQDAQIARDQAPEQVRLGLLKSNGTTRLSDLTGTVVDPALLPAILRAVAATADPEQVNDAASLRTLVSNVVTAANTVLAKTSVYGDNDTNPAPTTADFERLAIPGTDQQATLALTNAALKSLPASRTNTVAALRTIVEAAARVAALADGTPGNTADAALPSAADYTVLGVSTPLSQAAARVTGQVIDGKPLNDVAATTALEAIAAAAQRVTEHAAGNNLATPLTPQDFSVLGIRGVTADNVARLAAALRDVPASLRPTTVQGVVDTLAEIRAVVALDLGTLQVLMNYAQHASPIDPDNPALLVPTLAQYDNPLLQAAGTQVTPANLASINDALFKVGVEAVDSWSKIAALVRSYNLILAAADGVSNATALPTEADYSQVGVKSLQARLPGVADTAARQNAATLLGNVIDRSSREEVDTVAELDSLADIVSRVIRIAAGQPDTLSADEWKRLHVNPELNTEQLRIVLPAIAATADDGSEVTTLAALSARASNALGSAQRISLYADDTSNSAPTLADYKNIGVTGVDDNQLVGAINSALATSAIGAEQVRLPSQVQGIVNAYRVILGQISNSNGTQTTPLTSHYEAIGVTAPQTTASLGLLNSVLANGSKRREDIDTISKLQLLIRASDTIVHIAADNLGELPATATERASALQSTLTQLGVSGLQSDSMAAVLAALRASKDDGSSVDTLAEVQALADAARTAQNRIKAYADDATQAAPTLADYTGMGITGADQVGVNALNSILAGNKIGAAQVAIPELLQGIVDAFARILSEANEVPASGGLAAANLDLVADTSPGRDPLLAHYNALGLTLWGINDPDGPNNKLAEHLSLLNDTLKRKSRDQVDSLSKLQALGAAVALFLDGQGVSTLDDAGRQKWAEAANLLGLRNLVVSAEGGNLETLVQALRSRNTDQIDTVAELQALLDGSNDALAAIIAYANNHTANPAPTLADYAATGITAGTGAVMVDANNLSSINAAVARLTGPDVNTRSKLRTVVQSYNTILAAADGVRGDDSGAALQASHYRAIGVNLDNLASTSPTSPIDVDKLALFNSVVGAQTRLGVSTPERLESLAATVGDLIRLARESATDPVSPQQGVTLSLARLQNLGLADIADEATRLAFLDAVRVKGNSVDPVTRAPRSEDSAATHDVNGVNSIEELAAIASSYAKVMAYVRNAAGTAPQSEDYLNIGVQLPAVNAPQALQLLNSVIHAQPDSVKINTIAGLNRLALTVEQLMQLAAVSPLPGSTPPHYPVPASALSVIELQWLGINAVNADNLPFLLNKLQSTPNDGSALVSLSQLQQLADAAATARNRIVRVAQDNGSEPLGAVDLEAVGLSLPVNGSNSSAEYLKLVNEALQSTAIDASRANTPALLQTIIDAAQHVVDNTAGHTPLASARPSAADLEALGLPHSEVVNAGPAAMELLIDSITARPFVDLGRNHAGTTLPLPAKLSHLLDVIGALRMLAATGIVGTGLNAAELQELGVTLTPYTDASGVAGHHLPAILAAIAASRSDGSEVSRLGSLQSLATRAGAAQEKIRLYADETGQPGAPAPTAEDYRAIGLVKSEADAGGVRAALVTAERVGAINAALHGPGISAAQADTPAEIKRVVVAYNAILDSANGHAGDTGVALTAQQFRDIGLNMAGVTQPSGSGEAKDAAVFSLFTSLIDSVQAAEVATPARLEALGASVTRLISLAGQPRNQPVMNAPAVSEFDTFGVRTLSTEERDAFVAVLQTKGVADFDTLGELQALATSVRAAYGRVRSYADNNGGAAPTLADYQDLAITGISDNAGHREAVNAALATGAVTGTTIARLNALQAVVDSYRLLLQQADGTADNTPAANLAKLEDFEHIGVDMSALKALDTITPGTTGNAVQLLSSLVDSRTASAVDTPQEIQQLVTLVNKLALAEQGRNADPLQVADFALIGLTVDAAALASIRQQLENLPDNGSALTSFGQLRTLVLSVTGVPTWNVVAGDDVINLAERQAGVTLSGSAGQNDVLTLFYPDGTVMKSGITVTNDGNNRWIWSYSLTSSDWARLNADNADGVEKILHLQARNTSTGVDSIRVAHKLSIDTVAPPANLLVRLEQDTGSSATDGVTNQGKVTVTNVAADAQWEYQIDNGPFQTGSGNSFLVTQQGPHTISVRQIDSAGNRSTAQSLHMTLDTTAPAAPAIALATIGGTINELPVTNSDTIRVTGLEPNASWQWRVNRNDFTDNPDWINGTGDSFNPGGTAANQNRNLYVEVRQLDQAGNAGNVSRLSFTLDTTPPVAPRLVLAGARGDAGTGLFSNSGNIDIEGLEALGRWEYSLNGGASFTAGSGSRLTLPAGDGQKTVIVRQFDLAGNRTDSAALNFTLDTIRPNAPTLRLRTDSGSSNSDGITNDGSIRIEGLENGATWEYSLDGGLNWSSQDIASDNTLSLTDNGTRRSLLARQIDRAGNVSAASTKLDFTIDTTPPRNPRLVLADNTSGDDLLRLTRNGTINVLDLDAGSTWQYSTDGGTTWRDGVGSSFTVSGDGDKQLRVRQTDVAGNTSTSAVLTMKLDTVAPVKPGTASLVNDSGTLGNDLLTNDGRLQAPVPSEAGLRYEYSVDSGLTWSDISQPVKGVKQGGNDGEKSVLLRSRDAAGNISVSSDVFRFTLDTRAPDKPLAPRLASDTGDSSSDGITSNGQIVPSGPVEPTASFEYSVDGGEWGSLSNPIKGSKDGGMDGLKNVRLRIKDKAGNVSEPSDVFSFTLDTTPPPKATLAMVKPPVGGSTDDGTVRVANLEAGSRWEYSVDGGTTWSAGSGDSFKVKGSIDGSGNTDGAKSVKVRQLDKAGNASESDVLQFNLVTRIEAPTVNVVSPLKTLADGTVIVDAANGPNKTVTLEVAGRRGSVAVLTRDDGTEIERKNVDNFGKASFNLNRSLTVSGLKTVVGGNTTANAVYTLLSSDDVRSLRESGTGPFSAIYLATGAAAIDPGRPVYSTGNGAGDWFVWSAIGGGYVISRRNDANEWFREAPSSQSAQTPETVATWLALNRPATLLADDLLRNNGVSGHQSRLDGVSLVNANGTRDAAWGYKVKQIDAQGRSSEVADLKLRMVTNLPPQLDLDAFTEGVQASRSITVTSAEVATGNGVSLMPQLAAVKANDIRFIELVSDNATASPVDSLILDRPVGINNNLAQVDNRSIGGVAGLSYKFVTIANKSTVTITKTDGSAFTGDQVHDVLQALRLQNIGFSTEVKTRSIDISLGDGSGHRSVDLNRVTVRTDGTGLGVDLDANRPGVQTAKTRYINSTAKLPFSSSEGERFVENMVAPSASTTLEIQLRFHGLNRDTDDFGFGVAATSTPALAGVFRGDIGGVRNTFWQTTTANPDVVVIKKGASPTSLAASPMTGAEVKAILESIKVMSLSQANVERSVDITLVNAAVVGTPGITSRATLVVDTVAPILDLDANTPGIQIQSSQSFTLGEAANGVKLIKGAMAAPMANDIAMVRLTLPGGNDASNDNLILGTTRYTTRSNIDFSGSLGGVDGVELHYVAGTRLATISRTGGAALDGLQVKAILESLRYSFVPPAVGRTIPIEVVDRANNVGRGDVVLSLDNIVPTQLSTTLLSGSQKAYGVAKMEDIFGNVFFPTTNPHNLSKSEGVATPLPSGFASAASFLAAIRGISAEWGGTAIMGDPNRSNPNLKSYTMFSQAPNPGQELAVMQQGGGTSVLGSWLSFTLVRQAGKQADDVFINHLGSYVLNNLDLYRSETARDKSSTGIDLANIGLLYQIDTGRANKTPTIQVGYDGSRAAAGDVVALFEGNTLLARKVLTRDDVGAGNKTVSLTVAQSLAPGEHDIVARYTDTAGNTVSGPAQHVSVAAGRDAVTLTDLAVRSSNQAPASAQALNASENHYAVVNDLDATQASGHTAGGPLFSGKVGGANAGDRYVVTISMGGTVLAFDEVAAGDFAIRLPAGSLAPGLYSDLTITASRVGGSDPGQTTAVQGLKLGWYWAAQSARDIAGGNGNDDIALGATPYGAATFVQTGAGQDKIIVGSFGRNDNLSATVGDFTLGVDKVEVFNQTLTLANLSRFVTASAGANANDTRLTIDLDGAGPGTLTYTLMLQNVMYNSANTASIFGL